MKVKPNGFAGHLSFLRFLSSRTSCIIRFTVSLILISCLQVSAKGYTQDITLAEKNVPLVKIFNEIRKQTGYLFIYSDRQLEKTKNVTVRIKSGSLRQVLDLCFTGQPITYSIVENTIVVVPIEQLKNNNVIAANVSKEIPPVEISGVVTDEQSKPVQGVSVVLKGSTIGTTTDENGKFSLTIPQSGTLIFSSTGFVTKEVPSNDQTSLRVALERSITSLSEIVVVGYGTQLKKDVSTAISVVAEKDFNKGVTQNAADLLQGKVAGLVITTESGDVTVGQTIRLRGVSSLTGSSAPFVVIDGVPGMDISSVAPQDIESISVLKDASAAAIYGSRSASGVILITTKKGRAGQANVQYNGYVAVDNISNKPPMLTAAQWRKYAADNDLDVAGLDKGADTDWFDEITRTGITHNHNVSVSGGGDKGKYRASVNYLDREGILRDNRVKRYNALLSINQKALQDRMTLSFTGGSVQSDFSPTNAANTSLARNMLPVYPVRNEDGSWFDVRDHSMGNPVHNIEENQNLHKTSLLYANVKTTLDLFTGFNIGVSVFKQRMAEDESFYNSITSPAGYNAQGFAFRRNQVWDKKLMEITAQYTKKFDKHNFTVLGGYSYERNDYQMLLAQNRSFITDRFGSDNLSTGENLLPTDVGSNRNMNLLISMFGRADYNFNDKFNITATLRRDGSSKFGVNNKWGVFPSASAAWTVSQEPFLAESDVVNDLKLRVGYGVVGNQDGINPYNSIALYGRGDEFFDNGVWRNTYTSKQNANPLLKWEETASLNFGVDFSLYSDRVSGSVDYYVKKTSDMLFTYNVPVPPNLFSTMLANVGDMSNKGIEILLNTKNVQSKNWHWTSSFNFAHNKNKIEKLSNDLYSTESIRTGNINIRGLVGPTHIIEEGREVGTFYGWKTIGLDEDGKYVFEDQNKDGAINSDDETYIGQAMPKFTYGILNAVSYKAFDLTVFFRGVYGNDVLNNPRMQYSNRIWLPGSNVLEEALTNSPSEFPQYGSYYIEKGSFLRLDNASIGYSINTKNMLAIKRWRVYLTAQNLFVISKFRGEDPEVNISGLSPGVYGDYFVPKTRTFSFGVDINF